MRVRFCRSVQINVDALGRELSLWSEGETGCEFMGDKSNIGSKGMMTVGKVVGEYVENSEMY